MWCHTLLFLLSPTPTLFELPLHGIQVYSIDSSCNSIAEKCHHLEGHISNLMKFFPSVNTVGWCFWRPKLDCPWSKDYPQLGEPSLRCQLFLGKAVCVRFVSHGAHTVCQVSSSALIVCQWAMDGIIDTVIHRSRIETMWCFYFLANWYSTSHNFHNSSRIVQL